MTKIFFDFFAIFMNHLFNNQFVENFALRVKFKYFFEKYDCMNDVVDIVFIEFISKICNEKNMNMRQIFFLKFDNVNVRVYYFHDMIFDKIAQKFFEFQLCCKTRTRNSIV